LPRLLPGDLPDPGMEPAPLMSPAGAAGSLPLVPPSCNSPQMPAPDRMFLSSGISGEGNGKPLQHSCLENPMNSRKRQKDGKK